MKKESLSRSERHSVITSYGGLLLSIIAILLSIINMYQAYVNDNREIVQLLNAMDAGYYYYDDTNEKLFDNYRVVIANTSSIPVSIVQIRVKKGEETRNFEVAELPEILPLNIEANHTESITIPWDMLLESDEIQKIQETIADIDDNSDIKHGIIPKQTPSVPLSNDPISPRYDDDDMDSELSSAVSWAYEYMKQAYSVSLSITAYTAKNNQFSTTAEIMTEPIIKEITRQEAIINLWQLYQKLNEN